MMLSIRPATDADLPTIHRLYQQARRFMAENANPNQWGTHYPDAETVAEDLSLHRLFVCLSHEEICGVFCYFFGDDPDYHQIFHGQWLNDAPYGVVHRLAVSTKQKGIASFCLDFAFRQCNNLRIDTHRDNHPMQRTLEKNGFHPCGIVNCSHGGERIAYQKQKDRF